MNEFDSLFDDFFTTDRTVGLTVPDLRPVCNRVAAHFQSQGYAVSVMQTADGGSLVSLRQDDWFRNILGLKTALNIRIHPVEGGTHIRAGIGIFELQIIPTVLTLFVFAPIVLGQIWGIVQQNKLDEEAVRVVEDALVTSGTAYPTGTATANRPVSHDPARAAAERELGDPVI